MFDRILRAFIGPAFEEVDMGRLAANNHPRSSKWPPLEHEQKRLHPTCAACGAPTENIHHDIPYHIAPEKELDPANLTAFCRECHFRIGHGRDWKAWIPNCKALAAKLLAAVQSRLYSKT